MAVQEDWQDELRHLTSTATCLESLGEAAEPPTDISQKWNNFALGALCRPPEQWASEGSAAIYCRCRALPLVISGLEKYDQRIEGHLGTILRQLEPKVGADSRFAIGEADPEGTRETWYPPNAFHTSWTLEIFNRLSRKFPDCPLLPHNNQESQGQVDAMLLWARQALGSQIALHNGGSAARDTDQLIWALVCVLRGTKEWAWVSRDQDILRAALAAIFSTQTEVGNWPSFRPLFHYREAGNAYCYIFETLSALLRLALPSEATFLRTQLRPYCGQLAQLWQYAVSTAIPLELPDGGGSQWAWSSGHRSQSSAPESWATASVYSYAQLLRRIVGNWTRETALQELNAVSISVSRDDAESELRERGSTWSSRPVSHDLLCLFVNATRLAIAQDTSLDIDRAPIPRDHSRSAILYGPPGTSKTTLARSVAGALGWDYVEIHASHFVSEGLPNVQKRADEIFVRLMELDRAVVLFDEIDELVREREEDKADVFGRFLTTSMLPKVAELWSSQKVLYFVATNHVGLFDAAILRSQRFDAIIFVPPPAFNVKMSRLLALIHGSGEATLEARVSMEDCENALLALDRDAKADEPLPDKCILSKFILLRWDQMEELAYRLVRTLRDPKSSGQLIDTNRLEEALKDVADIRLARVAAYQDYLRERDFARRDFGKRKIWIVKGDLELAPSNWFVKTDGKWWLSGPFESVEEFETAGWLFLEPIAGTVQVSRNTEESMPE